MEDPVGETASGEMKSASKNSRAFEIRVEPVSFCPRNLVPLEPRPTLKHSAERGGSFFLKFFGLNTWAMRQKG